ncbi:MAG: hypothetical protein FHP94_15180 [Denitromonas halophila]|nr:MAG: hypothetical protein FHP94_15180 [Denitromonas halophila]TVT67140.1 MAG: hypothetical protein FHP93_18190 [Denitromonas halophila]
MGATSNASGGVRLLVLLVLLGISVFLLLNKNLFLDNVASWRRGTASFSLDLNTLSGRLTEAGVLRRFPELELRCQSAPADIQNLGDRVCYNYAKRFDGYGAHFVAFFLRDGKLASMKVDVPWWWHAGMEKRLIERYGRPTGRQILPTGDQRLEGWQLAQGSVFYNRDPDLNPLQWNTVYWMSDRQIEEMGGSFVQGASEPGATRAQMLRWLLGKLIHS